VVLLRWASSSCWALTVGTTTFGPGTRRGNRSHQYRRRTVTNDRGDTTGWGVMGSSVLRSLPSRMLVSCLVPLAMWETAVVSPIFPALASTRSGISSDSALFEAASSSPSVPTTLKGTTVVLDPGHNGANGAHPAEANRQVPNGRGGTKACDTTGTSSDGGYPEHAFNWDVALRVRHALTARGARVVMTRPDDAGVGPCVNDRAAVANRAGAALLVSIHADGAARAGHGFHVSYSAPPLNHSQGQPSAALAQTLARALRGGGFTAADYIGSGGLYPRSDLAGLNLAQIPAALVECANMRNPQEAALVSTSGGRARYAAAIADGIVVWITSRRGRAAP
jgi:N-acetylmuramoyl-L-alanine amidase